MNKIKKNGSIRKATINYRIYALILGEMLQKRDFMGCTIVNMDSTEQLKRVFAPIQGVFDNDLVKEYPSYATSLPYVDPLRLKSDYAIYFDSSEKDPKGAIGDAIKHIELACIYLSIGMTQDIKSAIGERYTAFYPYLYQIVKIYELDKGGKEIDCKFRLANHTVRFPRRPEKKDWRDSNTETYLQEMIDFKDSTLRRSLKYLYRSEIGPLILDSPEKIALDHFKSIEIVLNQFSRKGSKQNIDEYTEEIKTKLNIEERDAKRVANLLMKESRFKKKLNEATSKLGLTEEEVNKIEELWDERSETGDIAHPSDLDQTERYSNQFPAQSNVRYSGLMTSVAGNLILKYYEYKKNIFEVTIENSFLKEMENGFAIVNPQEESNHFMIFTKERDKNKLKQKIKTSLANELGIEEKRITNYILSPKMESAILHVATI